MFNVSVICQSIDTELVFSPNSLFVYANLGCPSNSPSVPERSWDVSLNIPMCLPVPGMSHFPDAATLNTDVPPSTPPRVLLWRSVSPAFPMWSALIGRISPISELCLCRLGMFL